MSERRYIATVKAFSSASGPASGITYTVALNKGGQVITLTGVKPSTNRPPDSIDTRAARVGTCYDVVELTPNGYIHLLQEWPDWGPCTTGAT